MKFFFKCNSTDISDDRKENAVKIEQEYTLDEAIEATSEWIKTYSLTNHVRNQNVSTEIGKFQSILVILAGLNAMGATIENVNFSFILPYAKCDLKLSIAEQSALSSVSFLGIVSTSYLWGFLLDTWGRKKVLCLTAFCGFFLSIFSTFATNTIILIALRFFAGALWVNQLLFSFEHLFFLVFATEHLLKLEAKVIFINLFCNASNNPLSTLFSTSI